MMSRELICELALELLLKVLEFKIQSPLLLRVLFLPYLFVGQVSQLKLL